MLNFPIRLFACSPAGFPPEPHLLGMMLSGSVAAQSLMFSRVILVYICSRPLEGATDQPESSLC